jgi:mono/diheme cytochrome c family protein
LSREYYQTHSPSETWQALRAEAAFKDLTDSDVWDLTAWVWQTHTTPQELQDGSQLYNTNCSACHGEAGAGDGVFASALARPGKGDHSSMATGQVTARPADFTDASRMLAASPALLQGKIVRGGMGTGMPYWGPIFTKEQTWALIAYLWTFQFEMEK